MKPAILLTFMLPAGFLMLACYVSYSARHGTGSIKSPPSILLQLPKDETKDEKFLLDWLNQQYPYESPESEVMQSLKDQGFEVVSDEKAQRYYARYVFHADTTPEHHCHTYTRIDWDLIGEHKVKGFHLSWPIFCGGVMLPPPLP